MFSSFDSLGTKQRDDLMKSSVCASSCPCRNIHLAFVSGVGAVLVPKLSIP